MGDGAMATISKSISHGAVTLNVEGKPCPWMVATVDPCKHTVKLDNQWPIAIHEIEVYVRPQGKLVYVSPAAKMPFNKLKSVAQHSFVFDLHPSPAAARQTEEVETPVTFHDESRKARSALREQSTS
jgi:hypothetical protein